MQYSTSSIQKYKTCPTQFKFHYDDGLRPIDREIDFHHRDFGSAGHAGQSVLYNGGDLKEAQAAFSKTYPRQLDPNDKAKSKESGLAALAAYQERYSVNGVLDPQWKVLSNERKVLFPDYVSDPFVLVLDLVVENIEFGGIYVVDHKWAKMPKQPSYFWNKFSPNSQVSRYSDYVKKEFGQCDGFYVDAIFLAYTSKKSKNVPVKGGGAYFTFERRMFNTTTENHLEEQIDTQLWINEIEQTRKYGAWRKNKDACGFCDFQNICSNDWHYPEDAGLIQLEYSVKEKFNG